MVKRKMSPRAVVTVCSVVYFVSYFSRKDFAAAMAEMIESGVIDKSLGGYISMAMFVLYGIGQFVSGFLGDRLPPAYLISLGLFTTALTNLLMPLLPSEAMVLLWALNGFAQAMLWPPIVRILADNLSREGFVRANLVVTCAAHFATVLLYLYVPLCILVANWKMAFFTASVMATVVGALVVILTSVFVFGDKGSNKTPDPVSNSAGKNDNNYLHLVLKSGLPALFVAIIAMGYLRDGIETWLPTLLSEAFEMNAGLSILISVLLPIFAAISIAVITVLHKTRLFQNESLGATILFIGGGVIAIFLCFTIGGVGTMLRVLTLTLACLVTSGMHAVNFLYISCLPGRFAGYNRAATTSGICNAFTYVGAAISMYTIPAVSDRFDWRTVMLVWAFAAFVGAALSLISYRRYTKFITKG